MRLECCLHPSHSMVLQNFSVLASYHSLQFVVQIKPITWVIWPIVLWQMSPILDYYTLQYYTTLFPSDYVYTSNNASMYLCRFVQGIWLREVKFFTWIITIQVVNSYSSAWSLSQAQNIRIYSFWSITSCFCNAWLWHRVIRENGPRPQDHQSKWLHHKINCNLTSCPHKCQLLQFRYNLDKPFNNQYWWNWCIYLLYWYELY